MGIKRRAKAGHYYCRRRTRSGRYYTVQLGRNDNTLLGVFVVCVALIAAPFTFGISLILMVIYLASTF